MSVYGTTEPPLPPPDAVCADCGSPLNDGLARLRDIAAIEDTPVLEWVCLICWAIRPVGKEDA